MRSRGAILQGKRRRYIIAASVAIPIIIVMLYATAHSSQYRYYNVWNFDSLQGLAFTETPGAQAKGIWFIKPVESAPSASNVLARVSGNQSGSGSGYHIAVETTGAYSYFVASVKLKIISGEHHRAAGLIVRFQDANHYFVLMADAMNHSFSLCRAQTGFEGLVCVQDKNVTITTGQWHSISAQVAAQGIAGYLDGVRLLRTNEQNYASGGQIGMWTGGDSNVYFDDLNVSY
jgi:hypothetical protein